MEEMFWNKGRITALLGTGSSRGKKKKNILCKRRRGNFDDYVSKDEGIVCAVGSLCVGE